MKSYSLDLRQRIVEAREQGAPIPEIATRFSVSQSTVKRYIRQWNKQGHLIPKTIPGRPSTIKKEEEEELKELVTSRSNWTLEALAQAWEKEKGIKPAINVLSTTLQRLKITRKKRVVSPKKETLKSAKSSEKRSKA